MSVFPAKLAQSSKEEMDAWHARWFTKITGWKEEPCGCGIGNLITLTFETGAEVIIHTHQPLVWLEGPTIN